jgi:peptide-methionine (S)-S-oxide reductase
MMSRLSPLTYATFAAGCFWGVQARFDQTDGVLETTVGYTGGNTDAPTYDDVCTDTTGHAEAIQILFDSARVSYRQLLELFWKLHNPTTLNRQGPDVGTQYRSAVFFHSPEQEAEAWAGKAAWEAAHPGRIVVTQIVSAGPFYPAEEYHQKYLEKRSLTFCH